MDQYLRIDEKQEVFLFPLFLLCAIRTETERTTATHWVAGISPLSEQRVLGKARGVQIQREERAESDGRRGEGQVLVVEHGQRKRPKALESACTCADRRVQASRTKQEEKYTHPFKNNTRRQ